VLPSCFYREEHISRKMDQVVTEAKAKLAKGDKKGESNLFVACACQTLWAEVLNEIISQFVYLFVLFVRLPALPATVVLF